MSRLRGLSGQHREDERRVGRNRHRPERDELHPDGAVGVELGEDRGVALASPLVGELAVEPGRPALAVVAQATLTCYEPIRVVVQTHGGVSSLRSAARRGS